MSCSDTWNLIIGYCDLENLIQISSLNKSFNKLILDNAKNWKKEDLYTLLDHKNDFFVIHVLKNKWCENRNINKLFLRSCENGCFDTTKYLLQDPTVDPNYVPCSKSTGIMPFIIERPGSALTLASTNGHLEIVRLLLKDGRANPWDDRNAAIRYACEKGHLEIVRLLLKDPRVNPTVSQGEAIENAINNDHDKIVELLLQDKRVYKDISKVRIIEWASLKGSVNIVKLILNDENFKACETCAIEWAYKKKHYEIVNLLTLDKRINPIQRRLIK